MVGAILYDHSMCSYAILMFWPFNLWN